MGPPTIRWVQPASSQPGAVLVKDINSGASSSSATQLVLFKNAVFFSANDGINGFELWGYRPNNALVIQ
jgi:hypothetical protein